MEPRIPVWAAPALMTSEQVAACELAATAAVGPEGVQLVVDLAPATFVASSALGMLVKLSMRLHERGGGLALASPQPPVARMLRMVGLEAVLPAFQSVEAASRHLASARPARV